MKQTCKLLLGAAFATLAASSAHAASDVLVHYTMADPQKNGNPSTNPYALFPNAGNTNDGIQPYAPTAGVTASTLSLGSGLTGSGDLRLGFTPTASHYTDSLSGAEAASDYITFTVSPTDAGTALDITSIDASNLVPYGGGDTVYYTLTSDANGDNFATSLGTFTDTYPNGTGFDPSLGSAFSNLTGSTEFRIYVTVTTAETSDNFDSGLFQNNINVDGDVVPAATTPEPGTYALLGLGLAVLGLTVRHRRAVRI